MEASSFGEYTCQYLHKNYSSLLILPISPVGDIYKIIQVHH